MAIDISNDKRTADRVVEKAKNFCMNVARRKPVYSAHIGNTTICTTQKEDLKRFISKLSPVTPRPAKVKEVKTVPLDEVNRLRKTMSLSEIIKKLELDSSANTLKVMLINAGYIKTSAKKTEEKERRDKKIRRLYEDGYTYAMIKEHLGLSISVSTIERICKYWV